MTFRTRILIGFGVVVLVPLALFGVRVRTEMAIRLTAEYERRVAALAAVIRTHLTRDGTAIARRLDALTEAIVADNRLRGAALQGGDRAYLLDYAAGAMRFAGLSILQIQDDQGRIVSSGHFRNEYDRLEPGLPRALAAAQGGIALIQARTPEAPMLAIARLDSLRLGGRRFTLIGGIALDSAYLAALSPDSELTVAVRLPTESVPEPSPAAVVSEVALPFVLESDSSAVLRPAYIVVSHSLGSVAALRHGVDVAFLAAVLLAGAVALLLGGWLSLRISRPLTALARKTAQIDMDRLDVGFDSERADEIGTLTRLLGSMTERLRAGAAKLREAERRIAMGDLARQVNHDIKNGLTPIRNVFRHFTETAATEPERLGAVFRERQGTVEASIAYLENLAGNYARLYPAPAREPCDVRQVIRETMGRLSATATPELRLDLAQDLPLVCTDQLVLRRILENLVGNAVDSLEGRAGSVTIAAAPGTPENGRPSVRITVADTGKGMTKPELDRAFEGFHSTKPGGTGLGLSIVRRLVLDANGVLRVETQPGAGSRFIVELPGA